MRRQSFFILIFGLLISSEAFPEDGGHGIKVFMQSPKAAQYYPGDIFSVSFKIFNQSSVSDQLNQKVILPKGWKTIPPLLFPFQLDKGKNTLQFFAVKIPENYPSGPVSLDYIVQGTSHTTLYGKSSFQVEILPVHNIEMRVLNKSESVLPGDSYKVDLEVINLGNTQSKIEVKATPVSDTLIEKSFQNPILIEPSDTKILSYLVHIPKRDYSKPSHHIKFELKNLTTPEKQDVVLTTYTKVLRTTNTKVPRYETFPIESMFVFGMRDDKPSLFINTFGKGFVDQEKKKHLEFLFRAPIKVKSSVFTQLGGVPEKYYLQYDIPRLNFVGGDYVYKLSPLTINNRFGRGGSLALKLPKVSLGTMYIHNTSALKNSNFASFAHFLPNEPLNLSFNFLSTFGKLVNETLPPNAHAQTYSLRGQYKNERPEKRKSIFVDAEYATSGKTYLYQDDFGQAYYVRCRLRPGKDLWVDLTKYYGNPNYVGYFQNQSQFNAALGFPIYKKLKGSLSYQTYGVNLDNNPELESSNRTKSAVGTLTCLLPTKTYLNLSGNYFRSLNGIQRQGYNTKYAALRMTQNIKKLNLQLGFEMGKYHRLDLSSSDKLWQNYNLNAYLHISKDLKLTGYSKIGYENQSRNIFWSQTYGGSLDYYFKTTQLQLLYEYSHKNYRYKRNFVQFRFNHQFPSLHNLTAKANVWNQSRNNNIYQFVVEYTIPWNAPIRKNKSAAYARGKVYAKTKQGIKPLPNILVSYNALKSKSSRKGSYELDAVKPGEYNVWIENEPRDLISEIPLPKTVTLEGGKTLQESIALVEPSSLRGNIDYFAHKESVSSSTLKGKVSSGKSKGLVKDQPCKFARIKLISEETDELLITSVDQSGYYSFDTVRPGRWKLEVEVPNLLDSYYIESYETNLALDPDEAVQRDIRILPKVRKFKMLD